LIVIPMQAGWNLKNSSSSYSMYNYMASKVHKLLVHSHMHRDVNGSVTRKF
jgi:hypothetical protein